MFFHITNGSRTAYLDEDWEIPSESLPDLEWLGAGSQGAVFKGKLKGEFVAVKRAQRFEKPIDLQKEINYLQHLSHENIVKFK